MSKSSLDDISSCQNGKNINAEKSLEPSGALFSQRKPTFISHKHSMQNILLTYQNLYELPKENKGKKLGCLSEIGRTRSRYSASN